MRRRFRPRPQVPLTLGNAIVAITEKHNRLFWVLQPE
jgi:hypothetical protein